MYRALLFYSFIYLQGETKFIFLVYFKAVVDLQVYKMATKMRMMGFVLHYIPLQMDLAIFFTLCKEPNKKRMQRQKRHCLSHMRATGSEQKCGDTSLSRPSGRQTQVSGPRLYNMGRWRHLVEITCNAGED